jgi:hypothetical protein
MRVAVYQGGVVVEEIDALNSVDVQDPTAIA